MAFSGREPDHRQHRIGEGVSGTPGEFALGHSSLSGRRLGLFADCDRFLGVLRDPEHRASVAAHLSRANLDKLANRSCDRIWYRWPCQLESEPRRIFWTSVRKRFGGLCSKVQWLSRLMDGHECKMAEARLVDGRN